MNGAVTASSYLVWGYVAGLTLLWGYAAALWISARSAARRDADRADDSEGSGVAKERASS